MLDKGCGVCWMKFTGLCICDAACRVTNKQILSPPHCEVRIASKGRKHGLSLGLHACMRALRQWSSTLD